MRVEDLALALVPRRLDVRIELAVERSPQPGDATHDFGLLGGGPLGESFDLRKYVPHLGAGVREVGDARERVRLEVDHLGVDLGRGALGDRRRDEEHQGHESKRADERVEVACSLFAGRGHGEPPMRVSTAGRPVNEQSSAIALDHGGERELAQNGSRRAACKRAVQS